LDTFADPPWLAARPGVGSLRAVSSSVRAVGAKGKRPLRVGATPVPHAEILDFVREPLAARDIDLQIEIYESFDEPNDLLVARRLDVPVPAVPRRFQPSHRPPVGAGGARGCAPNSGRTREC
jgi:hypothetical protein